MNSGEDLGISREALDRSEAPQDRKLKAQGGRESVKLNGSLVKVLHKCIKIKLLPYWKQLYRLQLVM